MKEAVLCSGPCPLCVRVCGFLWRSSSATAHTAVCRHLLLRIIILRSSRLTLLLVFLHKPPPAPNIAYRVLLVEHLPSRNAQSIHQEDRSKASQSAIHEQADPDLRSTSSARNYLGKRTAAKLSRTNPINKQTGNTCTSQNC